MSHFRKGTSSFKIPEPGKPTLMGETMS
jgi:hypothetical protein